MARILIRWLILTAAILAAAYLVDGIVVTGFWGRLLRRGDPGDSERLLQAPPDHPDPARQYFDIWGSSPSSSTRRC